MTRQIDGIEAFEFPSDLDRHPLLAWMGDDWVRFVTLELLVQFRRQDPGTEMLGITCEGTPELETRAREGSSAVTAVAVRLPLQVLLRDSLGIDWRLRGVGGFQPHATSFQIESTERVGGQDRVVEVLREARILVSRPDNDFSWSSWRDAQHALQEIDGLIERLQSGPVPLNRITVLFAPAGPMQELSDLSGWGEQFLALANRCDAALEAGEPAVRATFTCSVCGEQAGAMQLHGSAAQAELRRDSLTSTLSQPITTEAFRRLRAALAAGDAGGIFELDPEYAPFYCPPCGASYCAEHWDRWDVFDEEIPDWHDSIRGRCPRGHERMLED